MDALRFCHIRNKDMGAVTTAFFLKEKKEEKVILAGFSFCSPFDQFDRSLGRLIAGNRLEKRPVLIQEIKLAENGKLDVVATLMDYLSELFVAETFDVKSMLGVNAYADSSTPREEEAFRWWLQKFVLCVSNDMRLRRTA